MIPILLVVPLLLALCTLSGVFLFSGGATVLSDLAHKGGGLHFPPWIRCFVTILPFNGLPVGFICGPLGSGS